MKYYTIKPEYAENWTNDLEDEMKPVSMEEIERLAREWDVPVSDLMEQVEEQKPHWYIVRESRTEITDQRTRAGNRNSAARILVEAWNDLSKADQKDCTEMYAILAFTGSCGDCIDFDSALDTISLNIPPKSVSLDNGNSYDSDVEYLMQECGPVEEGNLWDPLVENMDDDTRELVESMDPVNDKQFLEWYLLLAPEDLVVG